MKIAVIADTHAGARNDSPKFDAYFKKFFDEEFFPRIRKEQIKHIIHLGDVFDRRKYINFQSLYNVTEYFFEQLVKHGITMYVVAGNHDVYYKNTNAVNSLRLLLSQYIQSSIIVLVDTAPELIRLGSQDFHFIPWITTDNEQEIAEFIRTAKPSDVCIGHFELDGFQMFQGIRNEGGMNRSLLNTYKRVFTGHFHTRSHEDNIFYLGSPYEYTWSDYDDPRGFHIFNTDTDELEFIVNPNKMFHKIYYDDTLPLPDCSRYTGCCVKIIVVKKTDFAKFELFIEEMYQQNVEELTIHEDFSDFSGGDIEDEKLNMEDTMSLLEGFVDATDSDKDKDRIKSLLKGLFVEAQTLET